METRTMITLQELADLTNGEIQGNPQVQVEALAARPHLATKESELAMEFSPKISKTMKSLTGSKSKIFMLNEKVKEHKDFLEFKNSNPDTSFMFVTRPKYALCQMVTKFINDRHYPSNGIHPTAVIDPSATIDPSASIGPHVYIGPNSSIGANTKINHRVSIGANSKIGTDCIFYAGVSIEDYTEIGNRVTIHANTVIGSDGYSYVTETPSNLENLQAGNFNFNMDRQIQHKILSAGTVIIEDDVEIGANTSIDRGNIGPTRIGAGTKIDNLCQIAHNAQIGKDCLIIANSSVAGSAIIGDRVTMAGSSACSDGVTIGNDVVVGAYTGVNSDLDPFLPVLGLPAIPYGEFMRRQKALGRLIKYQQKVKELEAKVNKLTNNNSTKV